MAEQCLLYDKLCTNCGECDMCDMDPDKRCESCGSCLETSGEYRSVNIRQFMVDDDKNAQQKKRKK